ncbi:hypothetical protein DFH01_10870 [Falsiroseomonas bella]|uniref:Uncharacterized protein n=1 Tax=Falsiroseomonas bella TaxID=2184016 RepID=A0A317FHC4_9PROT|nr:FCSD flavin-binding domain-containing protein [Falsiroseomonas bella]PWS37339.1 hypothetical protein DFH01_10870 [Falsiroseomonas bella]
MLRIFLFASGLLAAVAAVMSRIAQDCGASPRNHAPGATTGEHRRLEALRIDGWYESITQDMFALA